MLFLLLSIVCNFVIYGDNSVWDDDKIKSYFYSPNIAMLPISDWKNPSFEDYELIQKCLDARYATLIARPITEKYFDPDLEWWIALRMGRFRLIDTKDNQPSFNIVHINNNPQKKDKCVICYISYNKNNRDYKKGLNCIIQALKASHFDGHLIYRVGGWPNLKSDRLKYVDVPYAFKPFLFEEARDLGYEQILWLDVESVPVRNLSPIFRAIKKNGCCFFKQGVVRQETIYKQAYIQRSLQLPIRSNYIELFCSVIGFDVTNAKANDLLNHWIDAATKKIPFTGGSGDQDSLTILVNEYDMLYCILKSKYLQNNEKLDFHVNPDAIILHHYGFIDPVTKIPNNLFKQKSKNKKKRK